MSTKTFAGHETGPPAEQPFVGRDYELAALAQILELSAERGGLVLIEGEAGTGKSRLVTAFLESIRVDLTLRGLCYPSSATGPYFPFLHVLEELAARGRSPKGWRAGGRPDSHWRRLSGDARGERARFVGEVMSAILEGTREATAVLVVEDIQWADVGSLLLLNALLDAHPPGLLVLCTARTGEEVPVGTAQLYVRLRQGAHRIELDGLVERDVTKLAAALVGPGLLAPEEGHDLWEMTNGNPLFVRELILHLHDSNRLRAQRLRDAVQEAIPSRLLGDVIDARLRSVLVPTRKALEAAAVLGPAFSAEQVAAALGRPLAAVEDDLELAARKGLLGPALGRGNYHFAHPLFQSRLYQSLMPSRRRALHRKVARAAAAGHGIAAYELARHYALGFGKTAEREAVRYCSEAAEGFEQVLAYEEAAHYWQLAVDCSRARSVGRRAQLLRRLGWACWAVGNWTRAVEVWSEAEQLCESLGDQGHAAELALALGEVLRFRLDLPAATQWLERALVLLPDAAAADRARAFALLGSIRCLDPGRTDGLELLQQASVMAPRGHVDPIVGYWLAFGFLVAGDEASGHVVAAEAFEAARQAGNARAITLLAGGLIQYELTHLRPDMAEQYLAVLEEAVDKNDLAARGQVFLSRALVLAYAGRWHDVRELAERWMGEVRLAGKFPTATARLVWAEATRALGHRDVAAAEMQRAAEDLQEMRPLVPLHLARALLTAGDAQAAAEIVNVEDATARMGPRFAAARAILGDVASRLEDSALWERCLESLRGEARPLLVVYAPISVDRVRARLAMRLRRWAEAIEWFEQALAELHAGRAWYEYAQACLDYAEMRRRRRRRGDDTKAAALEAQAKELLISLGIEHDESRPSPGARDGDRFALTGRELEVLDLLSRGLRNQEIADALTLSRRTVERHLENIFAKMDVKSRAEAIVSAVAEGIVAPQMPDQPSLTRDEQGGRLQGSCPSCGVVPSHLQGQYGSRDGARSSRPPAGPG